MSVLANKYYHNIALRDRGPGLRLPLPVGISLIERAVADTMGRKLFSLVEEIVLQIVILVELEANEYV